MLMQICSSRLSSEQRQEVCHNIRCVPQQCRLRALVHEVYAATLRPTAVIMTLQELP